MPSRHFFHKNRSQASLTIQEAEEYRRAYAAAHSPEQSPLQSPAFPPQSAPPLQYNDEEEESYSLPYRSEEARFYQLGHPTRSQSQRSPSLINTNQPTIHLVGPGPGSASTPSSSVDDNPDRYYQQPPSLPAQKEPKKRRFFGLGSSSSKESAKDTSATSQKLGRSISVRKKDPQVYPDVGNRPLQGHWSTSNTPPAEDDDDEEEEEAGGAGLHSPHPHYVSTGPTPPEKDPLRSPAFPPPISHQEYVYGKPQQQGVASKSANRHPLERQDSNQSAWEKAAARQVQQHSRNESSQSQQTPSSYHPSPSSATSTSSHPFAHKTPQEAPHQYYQEQTSRPSSQQSLEPPPSAQNSRAYDSYQIKQGQNQASSAAHMQGPMAPPSGQQGQSNRRSSETPQQSQIVAQGREGGGYQPYNQGTQPGPVLPSNAPPQYSTQLAPQGQNYRGSNQPSPGPPQGNNEGRTTPPPSRSRDDLSNMDVGQLLARHDELPHILNTPLLEDKYRKVKKYYFDKDAQVTQLQNTLAHQRLSQSRTSLDDNEYSSRFSRLDGAINQLAFNIRREWRSIPPWLAPYVNRDAATQPTKEMTAVGRACISRWLVDELLERYFHPALDPALSAQLKIIEKNLRRFAAPTPSDEEKDSLLSKISNWRLATLDGLQEVLNSPQAGDNRISLTESLVEKLTASLSMMLKEPPPPGLEGGVSMIVELAVGIAANLPLESRDVFVEYPNPGTLVQEAWMKVETGLPTLTNPGDGPTEGDAASMASKQTEETGSIESKDTGVSTGIGAEETTKEMVMQQQQQQQPAGGAAKKKGMFGGFMGGTASKKSSVSGPSQGQQPQPQPQGQGQQQGPPKEERVRFSTFMAVEVRGRNVLVKAPVYVT